jgi:class 3 adenylate cyclase
VVSATSEDVLLAGREAMGRHAWTEAYEALAEADRTIGLSAEGLRLLAEAAWFGSRPDEVLDAFERASRAYLDRGDRAAAAMMAFRVAEQHGMRLSFPSAGGWLARAEELAAEEPDAPVHGYLAYIRGMLAVQMSGDYEAAIEALDAALEIAARVGDRDLYATSLHDKGRSLCWLGRFAEGLALMDQAMVTAVAGDLNPAAAGYVYCSMIDICSSLGEYRRSAEWTDATQRLCERMQIPGFTGICRVHRAELLRLHGDWPSAEEQARLACDELPQTNFVFGLGHAFYEIGEVRRRMGDLDAAEAAYGRANEFGREPEPGLSLVRLAQGRPDSAAASLRRLVAEEGKDPLMRLRLLVAQADVAVATGDLETAAAASTEVDGIVGQLESVVLHATAARVRGALSLERGDVLAAIEDLRHAREVWQEIDAPYEIAEVRALLGRAYRAVGDDDAAVMELRTANATFEHLGASLAAEATAALIGEVAASSQTPERIRRAFVFTDIVGSTDLVGVIGDEAWERLLAWHDHTLRSLFAAHGGEVAHHTGDGFFVAFPDGPSALASAVSVQRALAEHRAAQGFAPLVRMGVHVAEATRRGADYSGGEVHKAARIGAAASGDEILASVETLAETGGSFASSNEREISAKGISEPVHVVTVGWASSGGGDPAR